jgi:hypothetical protein
MSRLLALLLLTSTAAHAGYAEDRAAIKAMSGCYAVTFHFVETFVKDPNYPIRSKEYTEYGTEWIDLDVDTDQQIALQHVLVMGESGMKHWRQEWEYQPTKILEFTGNNIWATKALDAGSTQGQWVQKVGQVDDSPRYECVAPWVQWSNSNGAQNYWECKTYAPLPRREFSQRSDYNVLDRRNRHIITADGWLHEQDNRKLLITEQGAVTEIAQEKGLDTYRKVDASQCEGARKEWNKTKGVWHVIQAMWAHIESHHPVLHFQDKVDGEVLWSKLFTLADKTMAQVESTGTLDEKALSKQAHDTIHQYLIEE